MFPLIISIHPATLRRGASRDAGVGRERQDMGGVFLVGSKSEFFGVLGVKYGWLFVEGCDLSEILHLEQGRQWLLSAVEKSRLTADEAQAFEGAMAKAGLAENLSAIFDLARRRKADKVPEGFTPAFHFELCAKEECRAPLPHGYVCNKDGQVVSGIIETLVKGLLLCDAVVGEGKVAAPDAVAIFQQMLATDLAVDEADGMKRYAALPEEKRRELEQARARVSSFDLPGGGGVQVLSIPLREFFEGPRRGE